jgi:hypothetical protein
MDNKPIDWYSTQFITQSLRTYLKKKRYLLTEPEEARPIGVDHIIVAARRLSKEIIEIRGTITQADTTETEANNANEERGFINTLHFLFNVTLSPISFFTPGNEYEDRSLCLPDLNHHRETLEKLEDYFTTHGLHLKVYLVNENGAVDIFQLNPAKKIRA